MRLTYDTSTLMPVPPDQVSPIPPCIPPSSPSSAAPSTLSSISVAAATEREEQTASGVPAIDDYSSYLSAAARGMRSSAIRDMFSLSENADIISFAGGFPTPEAFLSLEAAQLVADVLRQRPAAAYQYGPTEGIGELRAAVADLMRERGVDAHPAQILLTAGSQQALDLIARTLADPGAPVLVELPGYVGGINAAVAHRADLIGCPIDGNGLVPAALEEKLVELEATGRKARFLYIVPNFGNPAGTLLPLSRRYDLVQIARRHDLLIVEDDAYGELYYDGQRPPLPLRALAPERVIYLGSFSKIFLPGLRVGWVCGPEPLVHQFGVAKQAADLCSSSFGQQVVLEWLRRGSIQPHVEQLRALYRRRRDRTEAALRRFFPADAQYRVPTGGFFFWITLPQLARSGQTTAELLPAALRHGVAYVAGDGFCVDGGGQWSLRLSFSQVEEERIEEGVQRLGRLFVQATLGESSPGYAR